MLPAQLYSSFTPGLLQFAHPLTPGAFRNSRVLRIRDFSPVCGDLLGGVIALAHVDAVRQRDVRLLKTSSAGTQNGARRGILRDQREHTGTDAFRLQLRDHLWSQQALPSCASQPLEQCS